MSPDFDPRTHEPLPIHDRIGADSRFTGRGVVCAFLDAGFYAHPDLTTPDNRIRAYHDLVGGKSGIEHLTAADPSAWHGMMTSVVAAGNGSLSNGKYRSLAPDMGLVLVKVGSMQRVHHDDIARGIEWVLLNKDRFGIRVLNISCGGDYEASYLNDVMSRFAEAAIRAGIVVVAAVGNTGRGGHVLPPASVPAVITVGGLDDAGNPHVRGVRAYRSSYGPTIDGLQKPEIITLADWLAAPILPDTPTQKQAAFLRKLKKARDEDLGRVIAENPGLYAALDEAKDRPAYLIRHIIASGLRDGLVIDEHYKMVDGTSFAAPIVSSVVAQMIEANPDITPAQVKRILIQTARRIPHVEVDVQGWGSIQPRAAVERAIALKSA